MQNSFDNVCNNNFLRYICVNAHYIAYGFLYIYDVAGFCLSSNVLL